MQVRPAKFNPFRLRPLATLLACMLAAPVVLAENLQEIYQLAANKDPDIRQARARYNANHTQLDTGRSQLLPQINATASYARSSNGVTDDPSGRQHEYSFSDYYIAKNYGLSMSQALVNFQAWYAFKSAKITDESATLQLAQSEQQLIIRVAQAYFNVLRSQANLTSLEAQEVANTQLLEQAKQRYDVGLATITDVYAAQAQADLVSVNKLKEQNNLNQRKEALQAIVGQNIDDLSQLNPNFPIAPVQPANMGAWVDLAQEQNLAIRIAALDRDAREQDAKAAKASTYPTVSLTASFGWSKAADQFSFFPSLASETSSIAVGFRIPLFSGGQLSARTHQANFNLDASKEGLTKSQRENIQASRNAYRSVETDIKAVAASAKAVESTQSSYESTQVGAEVGTRNIVEVLQAQQQLYQAQSNYINSRFDYVLDTLTLKQAAGVLSPQDVIELNQWLHQ